MLRLSAQLFVRDRRLGLLQLCGYEFGVAVDLPRCMTEATFLSCKGTAVEPSTEFEGAKNEFTY